MGKQTWYPTKENLEKVESLAARGLTEEQIASCLGIHACTLSHKKRESEQLTQAIKDGKAKGIAMVTQALLKNVQLGNVTAQIFYLKSQAKWIEAREQPTDEKRSLIENLIDKL